MLKYQQIVLCLLCLNEAVSLHTTFTDFYVESVKLINLNPKVIPLRANIRLKRSGQEYPKISFEVDLNDAIRNYEGEVKLYYSPLGNRRYMLLPYKVDRVGICDAMEGKLVQQVFSSLKNYSNVPLPGDQNVQYCELFSAGHYYVHNFMVDKSVFPRFMPTGRFRMVTFSYRKATKEVVQSMEFVATFV